MARPFTRVLRRATLAMDRGRFLEVEMSGSGVRVKLQGQRWSSGYEVPWLSVFWKGVEMRASALRAEKKAKAKLRKEGRR